MLDSPPFILVVDDKAINIQIIVDFLESGDVQYNIDTASNGETALQMMEESPGKYHVLLLDRMMPGLDGIEVLSRMKSIPELSKIPVILQSAMNSYEDVAEGMKAGAHYYLTKPFDADLMQSVVQTAVKDRFEYRRIMSELSDHFASMQMMSSACFYFKSIDEAKKLAVLLANACKNTEKIAIGLHELLINAVEHGNLEISYDEKSELTKSGNMIKEIETRLSMDEYKNRIVSVEFEKHADIIEIRINDEGKGFDWEQYLGFAPERAMDNHGRGIAMAGIMSFDKLEYMGCGNKVKITINNIIES